MLDKFLGVLLGPGQAGWEFMVDEHIGLAIIADNISEYIFQDAKWMGFMRAFFVDLQATE
jgi:hypothetical protein